MNLKTTRPMKLLLAFAFAAPIASFAAGMAADDHAKPNSAQAQKAETTTKMEQSAPNEIMERMQLRMRAMQQVSDPQARMSMMMAQMQDMQEVQGMMMGMSSGCPMAGGSQGMHGRGMMGGGMHGHMGAGNPRPMAGPSGK